MVVVIIVLFTVPQSHCMNSRRLHSLLTKLMDFLLAYLQQQPEEATQVITRNRNALQ